MLAGEFADRTADPAELSLASNDVSGSSVADGRPRPRGVAYAGVVHAPGRAQPARVPPAYAATGSILEAIKQPQLAAEITLQPVRRYGVDAAVLYSDIVVPVHAVGFGIDVAPGTGPVATEPLRTSARPAPPAPAAARRHRLRRRDGRPGRSASSARRPRCSPSPAPRSPSPATSSRAARAAPTSTPRR